MAQRNKYIDKIKPKRKNKKNNPEKEIKTTKKHVCKRYCIGTISASNVNRK